MSATVVYGQHKTTYFLDGLEVTREQYEAASPSKLHELLEARKGPDGHRSNCWPMYSDAAGINPEQRQQATEGARKAGVPTEFTRDGRAIFTSQKHRRDYCRLLGFHDRNGSYGDP